MDKYATGIIKINMLNIDNKLTPDPTYNETPNNNKPGKPKTNNSAKYKMGIATFADSRSASGYVGTGVNCWFSQEPISEIDLIDYYGNDFAAGSRYDLFGVLPRMVS